MTARQPKTEVEADVSVALGANIRRARLFSRWTQEELASAVGRSKQAVSGWENGRNPPDLVLLPQLATALRVSVAFLFEGAAPTQLPARNSIEYLQRQLLAKIGPDARLLVAIAENVDELRFELLNEQSESEQS